MNYNHDFPAQRSTEHAPFHFAILPRPPIPPTPPARCTIICQLRFWHHHLPVEHFHDERAGKEARADRVSVQRCVGCLSSTAHPSTPATAALGRSEEGTWRTAQQCDTAGIWGVCSWRSTCRVSFREAPARRGFCFGSSAIVERSFFVFYEVSSDKGERAQRRPRSESTQQLRSGVQCTRMLFSRSSVLQQSALFCSTELCSALRRSTRERSRFTY